MLIFEAVSLTRNAHDGLVFTDSRVTSGEFFVGAKIRSRAIYPRGRLLPGKPRPHESIGLTCMYSSTLPSYPTRIVAANMARSRRGARSQHACNQCKLYNTLCLNEGAKGSARIYQENLTVKAPPQQRKSKAATSRTRALTNQCINVERGSGG